MADPPPGGEQWNKWNLEYRQILEDAAKRYNIPVQALLNIGRLESDWDRTKYTPKTQAAGMFQLTPQLLNHMQTLWGYKPDPYNVKQAADAAARTLYEFGTGTGVGKVSYNFESDDPTAGGVFYPEHAFNLEQAIGAFNGGATGYMRMLGGDPNNPEGKWNANYVVQGTQGLLGWEQLSEPARNRYEFFWPDKPRPVQHGGIGSDVHFDPWATQAQLEGVIRNAPDVLNWADREALDPTQISSAFKQDPTGWYLDPNVFQKMPGSLTALQGAYFQDVGLLDPKWGFDLGSGTWQDTGGVGGWSLMNTSNPDVIESGLFQQWLPKGYQAAGPEVWGDTPLQFWTPDWSTDLLPSGASPTSGQFDLFNPQGQFDVNMLNAPGAVSPELGGWLQQQGALNPALGYNPVNQVWQDAPPAPGWQLMDINQYSPQALPTLQNYFQSFFPTNDFSDAFEGMGGFSQPNAIMNWVPPAPQGQQYQAGGTGGFGYMGLPPAGTYPTLLPPEGTFGDQPAGATHVIPGIFGSSPVQDYANPLGDAIAASQAQYNAFTQAQVNAFNQQQAAGGVFNTGNTTFNPITGQTVNIWNPLSGINSLTGVPNWQ